ncbi:MAG: hypothetical protein V1886_01595 [archaeon]
MRKITSKKGITELIAYVLLISMAIALSILVYNWLRFYVVPSESKACPGGVSLILQEYSCSGGNINITVRNKGLFNIDGYLIKINNKVDSSGKPEGLPVNLLASVSLQSSLNPSDAHSGSYSYEELYGRVAEIEIEPFRKQDNKIIYCDESITRQVVRSVDCL